HARWPPISVDEPIQIAVSIDVHSRYAPTIAGKGGVSDVFPGRRDKAGVGPNEEAVGLIGGRCSVDPPIGQIQVLIAVVVAVQKHGAPAPAGIARLKPRGRFPIERPL
ncbi:MAG: hypothetical protein ACI9WU_002295, partial [Myxococcota bacterium]